MRKITIFRYTYYIKIGVATMSLFLFECKKIWKKYKLIYVVVGFVFILIGYFHITYQTTNDYQEDLIFQYMHRSRPYNELLDFEKDYTDEWSYDNNRLLYDTEEDLFETGEFTETDQRQLELIQKNKNMFESDISPSLHMIFSDIGRIDGQHEDGESWTAGPATISTFFHQINYLLEHQIEPRQPVDMELSDLEVIRVDDYSSRLSGYYKELARQKVDNEVSRFDKGFYRIWGMLRKNFHLILIAILFSIFSYQLAEEEQDDNQHLVLFKLEEVSLTKLYLIKLLTGLTSSIVIIMSGVVSILLASLFYIGVGSLKYPVLYAFPGEKTPDYLLHSSAIIQDPLLEIPEKLSLSSISLGRYLVWSSLLLIVLLIFGMSVIYVISLFIKNELLLILISLSLVASSVVVPVHKLSPLAYFDIDSVVTGMRLINTQSSLPTALFGMIYLTGLSVVFIVIGVTIYRKTREDLKGGNIL